MFPQGFCEEINFICSLITAHLLWCISLIRCTPTPLTPPPRPPAPGLPSVAQPDDVIFKAILRQRVIICDIARHVPPGCRSRHYLFLSASSLHSPSLSLVFLSRSNQKAKPCRQLGANNKSIHADVWGWRSDRRNEEISCDRCWF